MLSIGDPDLEMPAPVLERAIEALRAGDVRYTPAAGRQAAARGDRSKRISAARVKPVSADNVIFLSGAQNALFAASLCVAGPGDEVLALEPLYPSYPATIQASGAQLGARSGTGVGGFRPDLSALAAAITPRTRALFFATPNNPSGVILSEADLTVDRRTRAPAFVVARGGRGVCGTGAGRACSESCDATARASR